MSFQKKDMFDPKKLNKFLFFYTLGVLLFVVGFVTFHLINGDFTPPIPSNIDEYPEVLTSILPLWKTLRNIGLLIGIWTLMTPVLGRKFGGVQPKLSGLNVVGTLILLITLVFSYPISAFLPTFVAIMIQMASTGQLQFSSFNLLIPFSLLFLFFPMSIMYTAKLIDSEDTTIKYTEYKKKLFATLIIGGLVLVSPIIVRLLMPFAKVFLMILIE